MTPSRRSTRLENALTHDAVIKLAPVLPLAPLTFASLMLINALFFHILPFVRMRGRFSPGLATAILLFLPAGIAVWRKAGREVSLDWTTVVLAVAGGAALMAYPIIMLNLRDRPYFRQSWSGFGYNPSGFCGNKW